MKLIFLRVTAVLVWLAVFVLVMPRPVSAAACTWTGATSTDWATASNWSGCNNTSPQSGDDVFIGDFVPGNQPTLKASTTINSLTIIGRSATANTFGGCLTLNTGVTLSITGNLVINGSSGGTTGQTCSVPNRTGILANGTAGLNVGGNIALVNSTGGPPEEPILQMINGAISISGNWMKGSATTFTAGASTVTFGGTTQSISGSQTTFSTLTIANGSTTTGTTVPLVVTFNINSGGKYIHTAANGVVPGITKNFDPSSTYEWRGGGFGNFPSTGGISFGNLIINSTVGNNSAGGNLTTVKGNLQILNIIGGSYRLASSTSPTLNITGNLIVDAGEFNFTSGTGSPTVNVSGNVVLNGGTLRPTASLGSGSPILNVAGNWINNGGTFTPGTSTVTLNGVVSPTNIQVITGTTTFNNLTIVDGAVVESNNYIANVSGSFSEGTKGIGQLRNIPSAATNCGSSAQDATGNTTLTLNSCSGFTNAMVRTAEGGAFPNLALAGSPAFDVYPCPASNNFVRRYWSITPNGTGSRTATVTFAYRPGELNGNTWDTLKVYKCTSTGWVEQTGGVLSYTNNGSYYTVQHTNVSIGSGYALGSGAPTAVKLSSFTAAEQASNNLSIGMLILAGIVMGSTWIAFCWRRKY